MKDATKAIMKAASRHSIDAVLEASATLMAQAAMRRADTLVEALAVYDLLVAGGRKAVIENWKICEPQKEKGAVN